MNTYDQEFRCGSHMCRTISSSMSVTLCRDETQDNFSNHNPLLQMYKESLLLKIQIINETTFGICCAHHSISSNSSWSRNIVTVFACSFWKTVKIDSVHVFCCQRFHYRRLFCPFCQTFITT